MGLGGLQKHNAYNIWIPSLAQKTFRKIKFLQNVEKLLEIVLVFPEKLIETPIPTPTYITTLVPTKKWYHGFANHKLQQWTYYWYWCMYLYVEKYICV